MEIFKFKFDMYTTMYGVPPLDGKNYLLNFGAGWVEGYFHIDINNHRDCPLDSVDSSEFILLDDTLQGSLDELTYWAFIPKELVIKL